MIPETPCTIHENISAMGDAAMAYAEHGTPVFPCRPTKCPYTAHGFHDASTDPVQITAWWTKWPSALIGVPTGAASGIDVLDIDGPAGAESLAALLAEHGELPTTRAARTGGGGTHYYFRADKRVKNSTNKLGKNIDIRGAGGYIIVPPSVSAKGTYAYIGDPDAPLAEWPQWIINKLCPAAPMDVPMAATTTPVTAPINDAADMPPVTDTPSAPDHDKARHWTDYYIAQAATGNRNATGLKLGRQLRDDAKLSQSAAWEYMRRYQEAVTSPDAPYTVREAEATLRQVYSRPPAEPAACRTDGAAQATPATPTAPAPRVLKFMDITRCRDPRPSTWVLPGWLPAGQVTIIGANGGTGKSTFALQIAASLSIGAPFITASQTPMRCLGYSGEDGDDVVMPRVERICDALNVTPSELGVNLRIIDAEDNPVLTEPAAKNLRQMTTKMYSLLVAAAKEWEPRLIVVDGASDCFDGDENTRRDVRFFIHALKRLAKISRSAVLLIAHINKRAAEGGKTDQHFSGSTAWNNSVRSRWAILEDDFSSDRLTLVHEKSNLGPRQKPKTFSRDVATGLFVPQHANAVDTTTEQRALLRILMDFEGRGEKVHTATRGPYATYTTLAGEPGFPRWKKGAFDAAIRTMERAGYLARESSQNSHRHETVHWKVTPLGELFATGNNGVKNDPKTGVKNDEKIDPETGEILQGVKNENP